MTLVHWFKLSVSEITKGDYCWALTCIAFGAWFNLILLGAQVSIESQLLGMGFSIFLLFSFLMIRTMARFEGKGQFIREILPRLCAQNGHARRATGSCPCGEVGSDSENK